MSRGLSLDLRARAVALIAGGMSRRAAARHLMLAESSAIKWFKRFKETGSYAEKPGRKTQHSPLDKHADWLLVGEAPGAEEDRLGEPFVGQAGRLLDNMLSAIGLSRSENVYIANVLKCRPPGNRNPEPDEVAKCSPHLMKQIELIEPKLIVAMGRFAAQALLGTDATIASLRGRVHRYAGVPLIVTYHPAYLLRNLPDKVKAWEDLVFARKTLAGNS